MKFSLGKSDNSKETGKKISITIPSREIESKVISKLNSTQKSARVKGFRKGKAPLDIITKIYEPEIRLEVINDAVVTEFYKLVEKKGLRPVGKPNLTPEKIKKNEDVKFNADFEIYPEIRINNLRKLSYTRVISSITEKDLNISIEDIRKKMSSWEPSEEISSLGDRVKIDFIGTIKGQEFDGNSAKDFLVEIGSKSMIDGFEDGLIGFRRDDKVDLKLKFPDDYGKAELASKDVNFDVKVNEVLKPVLPMLNEDFFKKSGLEVKNKKEFKAEVRKKLEEDLEKIIKEKSKRSVLDSLREAHSFHVPRAMIDSEINNLRIDTARKIGMDPKEIKDDLFPIESFEKEALNRVTIGVLLNKIIEEKEIKVDPARVKQLVQERASMYKKPEEVVSWFYSNKEQLNSIESISLEEQVIEILLTEAKEIEEELSYEECVSNLNT